MSESGEPSTGQSEVDSNLEESDLGGGQQQKSRAPEEGAITSKTGGGALSSGAKSGRKAGIFDKGERFKARNKPIESVNKGQQASFDARTLGNTKSFSSHTATHNISSVDPNRSKLASQQYSSFIAASKIKSVSGSNTGRNSSSASSKPKSAQQPPQQSQQQASQIFTSQDGGSVGRGGASMRKIDNNNSCSIAVENSTIGSGKMAPAAKEGVEEGSRVGGIGSNKKSSRGSRSSRQRKAISTVPQSNVGTESKSKSRSNSKFASKTGSKSGSKAVSGCNILASTVPPPSQPSSSAEPNGENNLVSNVMAASKNVSNSNNNSGKLPSNPKSASGRANGNRSSNKSRLSSGSRSGASSSKIDSGSAKKK